MRAFIRKAEQAFFEFTDADLLPVDLYNGNIVFAKIQFVDMLGDFVDGLGVDILLKKEFGFVRISFFI
jgi:hypothetical protein